uniref:Uncharacterized protein n=1 Tax=Arundo donax TaxID=35708 RepID=A0A0A9FGI7_ARUDO
MEVPLVISVLLIWHMH